MWGVTTDFTQNTWEYGGIMLDGGTEGWIDTNILQANGKTYHITKSNAEQIIMEVSTAHDWWDLDKAGWTRVQSNIGQSRYGAVEGPATFTDHSQPNRWYLFVDDLPTPGYQPMVSTDLDKGWDYLDASDYFLTTYTKHGGVISLTKAQYDALRAADATSAVESDLGTTEVEEGSTEEALTEALPQTAEVNLAYNRGTSELPVVWDLSSVDLSTPDTYEVTGVVQSISANKDAWVGKDGSIAYDAEDRVLYSSRAIEVTSQVTVKESEEPEPVPTLDDIIIEGPTKIEYVQGEELDLTGLTITAVYSDGSSTEITEGYEVTGYDANMTGEQTITITYGGMSAEFTVTVAEKEEPTDPEQPEDPDQPGNPDDTQKPGDIQKPGDTQKPSDMQKPSDTQNSSGGTDGGQAQSGQAAQTAVKTGDTTNLLLPIAGIAIAAVLAAAARKRKSR